jgi:hypothetical protein
MIWGRLKKNIEDKLIPAAHKEKLFKQREKFSKSAKDESLKLEHYSHEQNLKEIDPKKMGSGADAQTKRGGPMEHPHSFFYRSGHPLPEEDSHIHRQASSKYHVELPSDVKLYDLSTDPHRLREKLIQETKHRQVNPGHPTPDELHERLKSHGYHGFYYSKHPSMSSVVALYDKVPVKSEEKKK